MFNILVYDQIDIPLPISQFFVRKRIVDDLFVFLHLLLDDGKGPHRFRQ